MKREFEYIEQIVVLIIEWFLILMCLFLLVLFLELFVQNIL